MLGEDVRIDSFCHHCAAPIHLEMREGRAVVVDPEDALVYLALPAVQWWHDIITTCSNTMVFFASAKHRDASTLCPSSGSGASLSPDQVHMLSGPLYARRMALGYERPSKQDLLEHFAAMGLAGDFWKL